MPDDRIEDPSGTAMKAALASVDATCRTLLAQTVWLRLVHERATDRAASTTGPAYVQPMTLEAATSHEPKCDVCGGAKSQCMGVHPEGRWPSC